MSVCVFGVWGVYRARPTHSRQRPVFFFLPPWVSVGVDRSVRFDLIFFFYCSCFVGEIEEDEAERLGLVPSHAYAVLDVREVRGTRLLQVCESGDRKILSFFLLHSRLGWVEFRPTAHPLPHVTSCMPCAGVPSSDVSDSCGARGAGAVVWRPEPMSVVSRLRTCPYVLAHSVRTAARRLWTPRGKCAILINAPISGALVQADSQPSPATSTASKLCHHCVPSHPQLRSCVSRPPTVAQTNPGEESVEPEAMARAVLGGGHAEMDTGPKRVSCSTILPRRYAHAWLVSPQGVALAFGSHVPLLIFFLRGEHETV